MAGRRIGGAGGGSDPGRRGGGGLVVAVGLVVALGGGGTAAVAGVGAAGTSASTGSSSGARGDARVGERDSAAAAARLTRSGLRARVQLTDDSTDCVANSYGTVRRFFRDNPCVGLHRAQIEVRDRSGDVVLVPVSWVEMPDEAGARALQQLVDTHGTGNVTELSREPGRYRSVRYTGEFYASRRDGTVVVNAQAQPVARGWRGPALTSIATNAVP